MVPFGNTALQQYAVKENSKINKKPKFEISNIKNKNLAQTSSLQKVYVEDTPFNHNFKSMYYIVNLTGKFDG